MQWTDVRVEGVMTPRQRYWTLKLSNAQAAHAAELRKMTRGGASLRELERQARLIERARRELRKEEAR